MATDWLLLRHPDFVVLNKPAGVSFHSEEGSGGFVVQASEALGEQLWPVHRLDKMTSGLLIFATNKAAAAGLADMFQSQQINKTYLAISDKKPKKKQGKIIGDMRKARRGSWKLTQGRLNPAITRFNSGLIKPGLRLYMLWPKTGRTHQLRVAMKSLGAAIIGDERYQGAASDRGYLHAYRLQFQWQGESIDLCQPPDSGSLFLLEQTLACLAGLNQQLDNTRD